MQQGPPFRFSCEHTKDLTVYSIELPGISVRNIDITLERYNTLWYQLYILVNSGNSKDTKGKDTNSSLEGKHYLTCLSSEYIDGIRASYLNGILRVVIDNPYKDPVHIPILRLVD